MRYTYFFIALFVASQPASAQRNLKPYYFDLADFQEARVYYMECEEDPALSTYLVIQAHGDQLSTRTYLKQSMQEVERFVEVFNSEGSQMESLSLFFSEGQDEIMEMRGKVDAGRHTVFPWIKSGSWGWASIMDGSLELKMERKQKGKSRQEVLGKSKKCVRIEDYLYVQNEAQSHRFVYYAKEIGLCGIDDFVDGQKKSYRLVEILDASAWKELVKRK